MTRIDDSFVYEYTNKLSPYIAPNGIVYAYCELAKKDGWIRKRISDLPSWIERKNNVGVHHTLQQYCINTTQYENPTDEPYFSNLCFEFDSEDKEGETSSVEEAKRECLLLLEKITNQLSDSFVSNDNVIKVWFSGSRGFHVIIDSRIFGLYPSSKLHLLYRHIALHFKNTLSLKTIDMQVYAVRHHLRIPNSRRIKKYKVNGEMVDQYKIELTIPELSVLSVNEIRMMATKPREDISTTRVNTIPSFPAQEWIKGFIKSYMDEESLSKNQTKGIISIPENVEKLKPPVCVRAVVEYEFAAEKRHAASLTLATFFKTINISREIALGKLVEWASKIPWNPEKLVDRVANARSHIHIIYDTDSKYIFSCPFIRALGGTHFTGKEVSIPCEYKKCPYIKLEADHEQVDALDVSLYDTIKPDNFGKLCSVPARIASFAGSAYNIPTRMVVHCQCVLSDQDTFTKHCGSCAMMLIHDDGIKEGETLKRTIILKDNQYLLFVNVNNNQKMKSIAGLAGIPDKCDTWGFTQTETGTLRQLFLRTSISSGSETMYISTDSEKSKDVQEQISLIVDSYGKDFFTDRNLDLKVTCVPVSSPKNQAIHLVIKSVDDGYSELSKFKMSDELFQQLKLFQPNQNQTVEEKIDERIEYFSNNITFIRERKPMNLAYDLVFHSPLWLKLSEEESVERGWLQLLVIGDPGQGKSLIGKRLINFYRLGTMVDGATTRRTGLVYTIWNNDVIGVPTLRWGVLPQNDGKILMIDEAHRISADQLESMTKMRSDGRVEVSATISGSTWARTRLVFIANPKDEVNLDCYGYGAKAIKGIFHFQQDVRRLDLALLCRSSEVDLRKINNLNVFNNSDIYSSQACRNLVIWAWTRKPEYIKWKTEAISLLFKYSIKIAEYFKCDIAITEGADMRYRLGRIAQAVAAIVFSTDEKGEFLIINEEHVLYAANYFISLMTNVGDMGLDFYANDYQSRIILTDAEAHELDRKLSGKNSVSLCRKILSMDNYTRATMFDLTAFDSEAFRELWAFLLKESLIEYTDINGVLRSTPKFKTWLKNKVRSLDIMREDFQVEEDLPK